MKRGIRMLPLLLLCGLLLTTQAWAQELWLGGQPIGISIETQGVIVDGFTEVDTAQGKSIPAQAAGICIGDRIVSMDGQPIETTTDFVERLAAAKGAETELLIERGGEELRFRVSAAESRSGQWMLGVWLRDGVCGIGTLTFIEPKSGIYGALGHCVSEENTHRSVAVRSGSITSAQIVSVRPGQAGCPGELQGCADAGCVLGSIERNCESGIYGIFSTEAGGMLVETGSFELGAAQVFATVEGTQPQLYDAEICRIVTEGEHTNVQLRVTDARLLRATGGIVQGMSGSPILQNGKLVGAVTHVFVSDSARGYGIAIGDMLRAAGIES